MTDRQAIAAIRAQHLTYNICNYERKPGVRLHWDRAFVDPGLGAGPYVKLPVTLTKRSFWGADDELVIRVYPPARLRRKLAKQYPAKEYA